MWRVVFISCGLIFSIAVTAFASPDSDGIRLCGSLMSRLIYFLQQGSLASRENPVSDFIDIHGQQINRADVPNGLHAFESDVLGLFMVAPEFRDLDGFRKKWGLSEDDALDALTFYGTRVFYDEPSLISDPRVVLDRLRRVSRDHFLTSEDPLALGYLYYLSNVARLSVPEMATQLKKSEGDVYDDLSRLQISIVGEFSRRPSAPQLRFAESELDRIGKPLLKGRLDPLKSILENARGLHAAGLTVEETASFLGVGTRALEFVLHHTRDADRGVSWSRLLHFEGNDMAEVQVLATLRARGLTIQAMADRLNALSGKNEHDQNYRSAASVKWKLADLGLTGDTKLGSPDIFDPRYGFLKFGGKLVPEIAIRFIMDHAKESDAWFSKRFDITPGGLKQFLERHHLQREGDTMRVTPSAQSTQLTNRYEEQRKGVQLVLDWIKRTGKAPARSDFGSADDKVGIPGERFFGMGQNYAEGKPYRDKAVFENTAQAWLAIKRAGESQGIEVSLNEIPFQDPPESIRTEWKKEAVTAVVDWIEQHDGEHPIQKHFGSKAQIKFAQGRFFGTGDFLPGGKSHSGRIFSSPDEAWLAVRDEAKRRGVPFRLVDVKIKNPSEAYRKEVQKEAVDLVVKKMFMTEVQPGAALSMDDRLFRRDVFGGGKDRVGFGDKAFTGTGAYEEGGPHRANRIFDNYDDAWFAVKKRAQELGINFLFIDAGNITVTEKIRIEAQTEALDRIVDWLQNNPGKFPEEANIGTGEGQIKIPRERLFGQAEYAIGKTKGHARLFDSAEDAFLNIKKAAHEKGVKLYLVDRSRFPNPSPELRAEWRKEAVEKWWDWYGKNGRIPIRSEFGSEPGEVGVNYLRMFGLEKYQPGEHMHDHHIFTSFEDGWTAIRAEGRKRGIDLPEKIEPLAETPKFKPETTIIKDMVVDWLRANPGKFPQSTDFGKGPNQIDVSDSKLFGQGDYRQGQRLYDSRVYNTVVEAWVDLKRYAAEKGVKIRLLDRERFSKQTPELIAEFQREAAEIWMDWYVANGRVPRHDDFGYGTGKVGITYAKFWGDSGKNSVFGTRDNAKAAIRTEAGNRKIPPPDFESTP